MKRKRPGVIHSLLQCKHADIALSLLLHGFLLVFVLCFRMSSGVPPIEPIVRLTLVAGDVAVPELISVKEDIVKLSDKKEDNPSITKDEQDILAAAINKARKNTVNRNRNALQRALNAARRAGDAASQTEGVEGGLNELYAGQIIATVRPNWNMPTYNRANLTVLVRVLISEEGRILNISIQTPSGRPDFDASAVNALMRTQTLPPPPTPEQQDILIGFNSLELSRN